MLAGIVLQVSVMVFFTVYMSGWSYLARTHIRRAERKAQLMLTALLVASMTIIFRGVRSILS
jgi:hypothetical protein